ncbi:MAG: DNA mismatch repair protein MutL, partial [Lachnospiraceae bacterium]|nr:DNA mismatch repair protein MutL [Lachnospiraceae bacterium]
EEKPASSNAHAEDNIHKPETDKSVSPFTEYELKLMSLKEESMKEDSFKEEPLNKAVETDASAKPQQISLNLFEKEHSRPFRLVGQVFSTYWIIEMDDQMFMIDQHAAHEKVLYERTMKKINNEEVVPSQTIFPPMVVSLSMREMECFRNNAKVFDKLGFTIEEFGGNEVKVSEVPADLVRVNARVLLLEVLDSLLNERELKNADAITEKVASVSCKAAVKGNNVLSEAEAKQLISDMLTLENPYHCPHGRPTTISMSKYEIEKKFKRII